MVLQHLPAETAELVDPATGAHAELDRQPAGRAGRGHAAAATLRREDRPELRERRVRQRISGLGVSSATVARAAPALGRVSGHAQGHGEGKAVRSRRTPRSSFFWRRRPTSRP